MEFRKYRPFLAWLSSRSKRDIEVAGHMRRSPRRNPPPAPACWSRHDPQANKPWRTIQRAPHRLRASRRCYRSKHSYNLRTNVHCFRHSNGHSQVLEARGGIPSEMLEAQIAQARPLRGSSTFNQRAVPFSHGHDFGIAVGQKFAEAPHAAEIARIVRTSPLQPQCASIQPATMPEGRPQLPATRHMPDRTRPGHVDPELPHIRYCYSEDALNTLLFHHWHGEWRLDQEVEAS